MSIKFEELVILGMTISGSKFRPGDWAERLCGCLSEFGADQRIAYSPYVKPIVSDGIKCVVVNRLLENLDPNAYAFLMSFAADNELRIREGRHALRPEDTGNSVSGRSVKTKSPQL